MRHVLLTTVLIVLTIITYSQAPITEIEGFLEVYPIGDSTSVYIGNAAGQKVSAGRKFNTFVGAHAGHDSITGNFNSFFGQNAGFSNTSGNANSFFGQNAGFSNTSGIFNSFFGSSAGIFNTTGEANSFFGRSAGFNNSIGRSNSFFGHNGGRTNTTGIENSFFGRSAGFLNTTGSGNSFFGFLAGGNITTQSQMIVIGANAGPTFGAAPDSMRLYIDVEESNTPLVYGEFDNNLIRVNGRLQTRVADADTTYAGLFEETNEKLFGYEFEYNGTTDKLHLWSRGFSGNEAKRMTWLKNGRVGIGTQSPSVALDVVGSINATGAINGSSDVNTKTNFQFINNREILSKITELPITKWNYKNSTEEHIGPMAQDFYAAFGLGKGETTIATVDADGVALAAIQALAQENERLKKKVKELESQMARVLQLLEQK